MNRAAVIGCGHLEAKDTAETIASSAPRSRAYRDEVLVWLNDKRGTYTAEVTRSSLSTGFHLETSAIHFLCTGRLPHTERVVPHAPSGGCA